MVNLESRESLESQARKEMLDHQDLKACPELTDLLWVENIKTIHKEWCQLINLKAEHGILDRFHDFNTCWW